MYMSLQAVVSHEQVVVGHLALSDVWTSIIILW